MRGRWRLLTPVFSPLFPPLSLSLASPQPLPATPRHCLPSSAESHYRNTISNTSAQVFDRLQTNLYSGGKQKAAEIYLLSVEERNKLAREPWVTSELTWRWISAPCKCMERGDILHSVIQHIAACRIPLTPTAGTPYFCVVRMQLEVVHYAELFRNYCTPKRHIGRFVQSKTVRAESDGWLEFRISHVLHLLEFNSEGNTIIIIVIIIYTTHLFTTFEFFY